MNMFNRLQLALWKRRALNAFVTGNHEAALRSFTRIKARWPQLPGMDYNLGLTALALKRYDEAEQHLLAACERTADYAPLRALADLYYLAGRSADARSAYAVANGEAPDARQRAVIERRMEVCEDSARHAAVLEGWKLLEEGVNSERAGNAAAAAAAYERALALDDTNFIAANNLGGYCMNVLRDYPRALEYFRRADALAEHPVVRANIARLEQLLEKP